MKRRGGEWVISNDDLQPDHYIITYEIVQSRIYKLSNITLYS